MGESQGDCQWLIPKWNQRSLSAGLVVFSACVSSRQQSLVDKFSYRNLVAYVLLQLHDLLVLWPGACPFIILAHFPPSLERTNNVFPIATYCYYEYKEKLHSRACTDYLIAEKHKESSSVWETITYAHNYIFFRFYVILRARGFYLVTVFYKRTSH